MLQLIWGPRRLAGFMVPDVGAPATFTPESATTWSYYAYAAPSIIRITFDGDNVTLTNGATIVKGKKT